MKRNDRSVLVLGLCGIIVASLLPGCGSEDEVGLELVLVRPPGQECIGNFPCAVVERISEVAIAAYNERATVMRTSQPYQAGARANAPSFPFGDRLQVTVEGLDGEGNNLASGATIPFSLQANSSPAQIRVLTTRVQQFTRAFGFDDRAPSPEEEVVDAHAFFGPAGAGHTLTRIPGTAAQLVVGGASTARPGEGVGGTFLGELTGEILLYDESTGLYEALELQGCAQPGTAQCVARLATPRAFHTATALPDGRIVVAGGLAEEGDGYRSLRSVEVVTVFPERLEARVEPITPGLSVARSFHTASSMPDGRIVFVGGFPGRFEAGRSALQELGSVGQTLVIEEIRPADELRVTLAGAELRRGRALHAAALIEFRQLGLVVSGGIDNNGNVLDDIEVFFIDPNTRDLVRDGLDVGGGGGAPASEPGSSEPAQSGSDPSGEASAEKTGGSVRMGVPRYGHRALTVGSISRGVEDQAMIVVGGFTEGPDILGSNPNILFGRRPTDRVEQMRIVPDDQGDIDLIFSAVRKPTDEREEVRLPEAVAFPSAVVLPLSRDVLVAGGVNADGEPVRTATRLFRERGDLEYDTLVIRASGLTTARAFAPISALSNHLILVAGGWAQRSGASAGNSDLFNPNSAGTVSEYVYIPFRADDD